MPLPAGRITSLLLLSLAIAPGISGQPRFEVASIRPAPPPVPGRGAPIVRGGPGSSDPGLAAFENIDLFSLTTMAYGIRRYQLVAPDWMSTTRFNITARVPAGATTDDYRLMLQGLLTERFKLTLRHEQKEMQIAELVVAKNGPKLKESEPDPSAPVPDGLQPPSPRAGPPPGYHGAVNLTLPKESMERFAALLSGLYDQPVIDGTGLTGLYDVTLHALVGSNPPSPDAPNAPLPLIDAIQEQLGLKLMSKKAAVDVLVVDNMEKTPTEN
jgi:uncharacterized protein (TIGR03435 family)